MSGHTPGPWRYNPVQEGTLNIATGQRNDMRDAGFAITAQEPRSFGGTRLVDKGIRSEADARLIAAAPLMAERLLDIVHAYESGSASALQVWIEDTRALLAKAGVL